MRKWSRWQDWAALAAGVYALLSPIWTDTTDKATWTMIVLGVVTGAVALWSLAAPGKVAADWGIAVLGVLFFISPWVMSFETVEGMAWTGWIVGVITFVAGVLALPQMHFMHRGGAVASH